VTSRSGTVAEGPVDDSIGARTRTESGRRGLFYRIIAANADVPVLEFGA